MLNKTSCLYWNCRGLDQTTLNSATSIAIFFQVDVIFLSETWHSSFTSSIITAGNYKSWNIIAASPLIQVNDRGRQHGGLLALSRPGLDHPLVFQDEFYLALQFGTSPLIIGAYFPPSLINSPAAFSGCLQRINNLGIPIGLLLGDLNIRLGSRANDSTSSPNPAATMLSSWLDSCQLDYAPIPKLNHPDWIQHAFINPQCSLLDSAREPCPQLSNKPMSDHDILLVSLMLPAPSPAPTPMDTVTMVNPSRQLFSKYLNNNDIRHVLSNSLRQAFSTLPPLNSLISYIQTLQHSPHAIHEAQSVVDNLNSSISQLLLGCSSEILGTYSVKEMKSKPPVDIEKLDNDYSKIRRAFRACCRSKQAASTIISRSADTPVITDCENFYKALYAGNDPLDTRPDNSDSLDYLNNLWVGEQHDFNAVSVDDISVVIKTYPATKARGSDCISPLLLKALDRDKLISSTLVTLFNLCIWTGLTPQNWNETLVLPISKNSERIAETIDVRRPISITQIFRRLFEAVYIRKCVLDQNFGPNPNAFCREQAGFRRRFSTFSHILTLHETLLEGKHDSVFLDLRKAYDSVDLELLMDKLKARGICLRFRALVRALYFNTTGRILVNGTLSNQFSRHRGLLQGGLWSCLLFNIFIDDLPASIQSHNPSTSTVPPLLLFADDTAIHYPHTGRPVTNAIYLQTRQWMAQNHLVLNEGKSKVILSRPLEPEHHHLDVFKLESVEVYKYLGIMLGRNGIRFADTLDKATLKATSLFSFIRFKSQRWSARNRFLFWIQFIRPTLEYGLGISFQVFKAHGGGSALKLAFDRLFNLEAEVQRWIFDLHQNERVPAICYTLTSSTSQLDRCEHLLAFTARHCDAICSEGSILAAVRDQVSAKLVWPATSIIGRIRLNQRFLGYIKSGNEFAAAAGNLKPWVIRSGKESKLLFRKNPLPLKTHLVLADKMQRVVSPLAAVLDIKGADCSLSIPSPFIRRQAILFRLNKLLAQLRCRSCLKRMNRRCLVMCVLFQDCTSLPAPLWHKFDSVCAAKNVELFNILDFLLNQNKWILFARAIHHLFSSNSLINSQHNQHPRISIQLELDSLDELPCPGGLIPTEAHDEPP